MIHFTWFDFAIMGVLFLSVVVSFFRGFLREAFSLVGWILAVLLALKFSYGLSLVFSNWFSSPTIRYVVAFATIFVVVLLIAALIGRVLKSIVSKTGLGIVDRSLGVCFGLVRGVLAVAIFLMLINVSVLQQARWFTDSRLVHAFQPIETWLNHYVPTQFNHVSAWVSDHPKNLKAVQDIKHARDIKDRVGKYLSE